MSDGVSLCDHREGVKLQNAGYRWATRMPYGIDVDTPANHDYPGLEKRRGR
jgi:hypothetical protein